MKELFKKLKIVCFGIFLTNLWGLDAQAHSPGAHQHGVAKLHVLQQGNKINFVLEAPTESIYGFETEAVTDEQKAAKEAAMNVLRNQSSRLFPLPDDRKCQWGEAQIEVKTASQPHAHAPQDHQHSHAEHRDLLARWSAECEESLAGTRFRIDWSEIFPRIRSLRVEIQADSGSRERRFRNARGRISLGR